MSGEDPPPCRCCLSWFFCGPGCCSYPSCQLRLGAPGCAPGLCAPGLVFAPHHGPFDICLDLLPTTPLPPHPKTGRTAQVFAAQGVTRRPATTLASDSAIAIARLRTSKFRGILISGFGILGDSHQAMSAQDRETSFGILSLSVVSSRLFRADGSMEKERRLGCLKLF